MTDKPKKKIWSRRDFLMQSGGGMAGLALASLMNDDKAFDLCLKAGQISIHDGHLVHSSLPNHSQRRRCGLTVRFVKPEVRQTELNSQKGQWNPVLVRGKDAYGHFPIKELPFPLK